MGRGARRARRRAQRVPGLHRPPLPPGPDPRQPARVPRGRQELPPRHRPRRPRRRPLPGPGRHGVVLLLARPRHAVRDDGRRRTRPCAASATRSARPTATTPRRWCSLTRLLLQSDPPLEVRRVHEPDHRHVTAAPSRCARSPRCCWPRTTPSTRSPSSPRPASCSPDDAAIRITMVDALDPPAATSTAPASRSRRSRPAARATSLALRQARADRDPRRRRRRGARRDRRSCARWRRPLRRRLRRPSRAARPSRRRCPPLPARRRPRRRCFDRAGRAGRHAARSWASWQRFNGIVPLLYATSPRSRATWTAASATCSTSTTSPTRPPTACMAAVRAGDATPDAFAALGRICQSQAPRRRRRGLPARRPRERTTRT